MLMESAILSPIPTFFNRSGVVEASSCCCENKNDSNVVGVK
jgi:hypothetical protein